EEQQNDITTTAKEVVVEEPFQTLKKNTGICWSKARLFCALCKAAGIPARLVVANGPYVWSEVWINEMGWIPVETSLPVYDYGAANRLAFPKVFLDTRIPVSSISGNDDDTKSIDWYPGVKASFDHVNPAELKELSKLSQAKILILEPAEKNEIENIPLETMIPMCEGLYFIASKSQEIPEEIKPPENLPKETTLKEIYDPSFEDKEIKNTEKIEKELYKTEEPDKFIETKKETTTVYSILIFNYKKELIDEIKFNELNKSVIIEKKNLVNLNIVPVKIGDYIILEIIKWELSKEKPEPQKTPTPTPGKEVTPSITPEPGKESNPVPGITPPPVPPGE
ncbi:MAG TPA: transglutaminase domain-containing protein, partial [Candidatus Eremiobacteraeota bacterium]|nr:transglutaminase domain-containing protein [Candidatus Eremiobacteraeota bacterium]